jgi:hypothetical protein
MRASRSLSHFITWYSKYDAVLRSINDEQLFKLIEIAEPAIRLRRDVILEKPGRRTELKAIEKALHTLDKLKIRHCVLRAPSKEDTVKAKFDEIRYAASGKCSICGDLLLGGDAASPEEARKRLDFLLEGHLEKRHRMNEEYSKGALHQMLHRK